MSEGNGTLPSGWATTTLGEIVSSVSYGHTASATSNKVGPRFLRITDLQNGTVNWQTVPFCKCSDQATKQYRLKPGDIVIARTGATTGKSYLLKNIPEPAIFASYLIRLETLPAVRPEYLAAFMQGPDYWQQIMSVRKGMAQPGANATTLKTLRLPLPPLPEQRRIVSKIESLQERSSRARTALAEVGPLLEQFRRRVLSAAFSGRLTADWRAAHPDVEPASELLHRIQTERRHRWEQAELAKSEAKGRRTPKGWKAKYKEPPRPDTSHLPKLPRGWCWVSIDEIANKVSDGVHKKPHYVESGVPFLSVKNLTAGPGISFEDVRHIAQADHHDFIRRTHPEKGDILVTKDGTLGVIRLIDTDTPFSIFVSLALIKLTHPTISPFLAKFLESPQGQAGMKATGSGLQHIHLIDLRATVVPLAPQAEQDAIVDQLNAYTSAIASFQGGTEAVLAELTQLDQSILAKAFRGELVPQDPSDEPASELLARIRTARITSPSKEERQED